MEWTAKPRVSSKSTEIILNILDSKYEMANLEEISQS